MKSEEWVVKKSIKHEFDKPSYLVWASLEIKQGHEMKMK